MDNTLVLGNGDDGDRRMINEIQALNRYVHELEGQIQSTNRQVSIMYNAMRELSQRLNSLETTSSSTRDMPTVHGRELTPDEVQLIVGYRAQRSTGIDEPIRWREVRFDSSVHPRELHRLERGGIITPSEPSVLADRSDMERINRARWLYNNHISIDERERNPMSMRSSTLVEESTPSSSFSAAIANHYNLGCEHVNNEVPSSSSSISSTAITSSTLSSTGVPSRFAASEVTSSSVSSSVHPDPEKSMCRVASAGELIRDFKELLRRTSSSSSYSSSSSSSSHEILQRQTAELEAKSSGFELTDECPICMEALDTTKKPVVSRCGNRHFIHKRCMIKHYQANTPHCPICRQLDIVEYITVVGPDRFPHHVELKLFADKLWQHVVPEIEKVMPMYFTHRFLIEGSITPFNHQSLILLDIKTGTMVKVIPR